MKSCVKWALWAAVLAAAQAQDTGQIRRATISGSGGTSGKCTIEVRVDITAEIDVYGDSGRLRTLAGQPATWTRLECTSALPYNMSDFRFKGIDGRGKVRLVQDPRNNNSVAVVRIDDPGSGAEGYTFEIQWDGASGGAPTGGFTATGWGDQTAGRIAPSRTTNAGAVLPNRGRVPIRGNRIAAERAMDVCRAEVHTRGARDYGLSSIDVSSIAVDTSQGRRDWLTGAFNDVSDSFRRGGEYRFNCEVDYGSGVVRTVQFLRADGSAIQSSNQSVAPTRTLPARSAGYDQNLAFRACQDAVVARASRDGYQNVVFSSTVIDASRTNRVAGAITASRASVTDTFDFGCTMDLNAASVRNLELTRR
jgi:hypothetical protein